MPCCPPSSARPWPSSPSSPAGWPAGDVKRAAAAAPLGYGMFVDTLEADAMSARVGDSAAQLVAGNPDPPLTSSSTI